MARVKISEYRAKKILLGDTYTGIQCRASEKMSFPKGRWVVKVDQGMKKRFKQGLLAIDKKPAEFLRAVRSWEKKGFTQFLREPLILHTDSEEHYLSFERVREGVRVLYAKHGGVDIETHPEVVQTYLIHSKDDITHIAQKSQVPETFLKDTYTSFNDNFFAFLEINPLVITTRGVHILDVAALVDSAGVFSARGWDEHDIVRTKANYAAEEHIEMLAATTPASLKLSVINTKGAIFLLLSGGGGSIVIADEAHLEGASNLIANYGEYSGGPTREETYLYAKEIIGLIPASPAEKKALVIAGGIANFTDIRSTLLGIIDALRESAAELRKCGVKVFVRRGGPDETTGLELMRIFLEEEGLLGSVHGSDTVLTQAMVDAITYVRT